MFGKRFFGNDICVVLSNSMRMLGPLVERMMPFFLQVFC